MGAEDGGLQVVCIEKGVLMGSLSRPKNLEGREHLKICTLPLGIRKWAPTMSRSRVRSKGLSDKGAPGAKGGAPVF